MRALVLALLLPATANATTIFPNGGEIEQTPNLWISSDHMPSIEVIGESGPILYEVDESLMEHGLRRFSLRPQAADGPFIVKLDGRSIKFHADASLDREDDEHTNVDFTRVGIERIRGRDTLVIEARAEPHTVLYFLNHSSPRSSGPNVFARYVWSGPGRVIDAGVDGHNGLVQFELPLAELGASCSSTATVEVSPYTTHVSGSTTLHPIGMLELKRGKVMLPVEMVGRDRDVAGWQTCLGSSVAALPPGSGILMSPTAAVDLASLPEPVPPTPAPYCRHDHQLALPPSLTPSADGVSGDETELVWWTAPLALLGIGLAMWRATSRAAA